MTAKIILMGQAPSRGGDPRKPLSGGRVGRMLMELFGATEKEYLSRTERHNVLNKWSGKSGKGDAFPMGKARRSARRLTEKLIGRRVIFVGKSVAAAFRAKKEYLEWREFLGCEVAVLPHPSGVNRWWNEPKNRRAARAFMCRAWRGRTGRGE